MPSGNYKNKAYPLRINEELMDKLKDIAIKENRTTNKQIEKILYEWVDSYEHEHIKEKLKLSNSKIS